jgi:hypothetical protein
VFGAITFARQTFVWEDYATVIAAPQTNEMTEPIRIYADWNSRDEHGRLLLSISGARSDLTRHANELVDGMEVTLNVQDEFELQATLVFDRVWRAIPKEHTIRYY